MSTVETARSGDGGMDAVSYGTDPPGGGGASTVLHEVARQVERTPDAIAAIGPGSEITYGRLAARAGAVARVLRDRGVRPGDVVGVALPRSADYVAVILGLWQAGAVFLPLDPALPPERLRFQREQAGMSLLLDSLPPEESTREPGTGDAWEARAPRPEGEEVSGTARTPETRTAEASEPGTGTAKTPGPRAGGGSEPREGAYRLPAGDVRPEQCAYVMFTSGSTGRPKAVRVSHASLHNCVRAVAELLAPGPADRYAANQTFSFDISLLEMFVPLSHGGATLVTSEALQADPGRLVGWLEEHGVTVVHATPTAWRALLPHLTPGREALQAVCGGEVLTARLAAELAGHAGRVWNFYGPTEVTVWCTAGLVDAAEPDPLPVGRPLDGYRVVVLGDDGTRVPDGEQGEIHVGGRGVALGYGGAPELTAERFVEHPEHGRLYRTGDLGRMRADGQLRFDGRRDRQVQLRGYRIELGEIESVAQEHPLVELAAAHVVDGAGSTGGTGGADGADGVLLLFAQGAVTPRALRKHLAAHLPSYMIPARIDVRGAFPLTPTKKIDRVALLASANR
ncbi:amino acid adenylation domain-containing protein [Streptosporangium sp. NPDC002524]|uniref:amino acid adenylation domain-containing protein n=1 Tax=Streptosporangium sp. NPDC002524 TaxID=3154537 RepID=UPI003331927F